MLPSTVSHKIVSTESPVGKSKVLGNGKSMDFLSFSLGGYAILGDKDGKGYLLSITIHPKNRNQGYTVSLLRFLESKCHEKRLPQTEIRSGGRQQKGNWDLE